MFHQTPLQVIITQDTSCVKKEMDNQNFSKVEYAIVGGMFVRHEPRWRNTSGVNPDATKCFYTCCRKEYSGTGKDDTIGEFNEEYNTPSGIFQFVGWAKCVTLPNIFSRKIVGLHEHRSAQPTSFCLCSPCVYGIYSFARSSLLVQTGYGRHNPSPVLFYQFIDKAVNYVLLGFHRFPGIDINMSIFP